MGRKPLVTMPRQAMAKPGSQKRSPRKFLDCQVCFDPCRVGEGVKAVTCGTCTALAMRKHDS